MTRPRTVPAPAQWCPRCQHRCNICPEGCAPGGDYRGPARAIVLLLVCAAVLVGLWVLGRWPW